MYSFGNVLKNMTKQQKIGAITFLAIIGFLIIVLFVLIAKPDNASLGDTEDGEAEENISATEIVEEGINGSIIESGSNNAGNSDGAGLEKIQVPVSTDYDDEHEYTLIDYLPKGEYMFQLGEESDENMVTYYYISENTAVDKGIVVSVDACDEDNNKAAANEYLRTLPVDLSEYTIVYQTHMSDIPCEER